LHLASALMARKAALHSIETRTWSRYISGRAANPRAFFLFAAGAASMRCRLRRMLWRILPRYCSPAGALGRLEFAQRTSVCFGRTQPCTCIWAGPENRLPPSDSAATSGQSVEWRLFILHSSRTPAHSDPAQQQQRNRGPLHQLALGTFFVLARPSRENFHAPSRAGQLRFLPALAKYPSAVDVKNPSRSAMHSLLPNHHLNVNGTAHTNCAPKSSHAIPRTRSQPGHRSAWMSLH